MEPHRLRFFLDSGAFSSWSVGKPIDIDEYCAFIRANIEHLDVYASLDVIPGAPGRPVSPTERDAAAQKSWENYLYMKNDGLDPLPVYHYGEDPKWLHNMINFGCQYIGIGGLVGIPSGLRQQWLDRVFTLITDDAGIPKVKTHGFGMTAVPLIFRYPWFSVDSTSWIRVTQNGAVYLPAVVNGEFVFDRTPTTVFVSNRSPNAKQDGKHSNSMGANIRAVLEKWIESCGTTLELCGHDYYYRALCNVTYFKKVAAEKAGRPFTHRLKGQAGFFS